MRFRPQAVLVTSLLFTLPGIVALPQTAQAQNQDPAQATVTSVKGTVITLGVGKQDGAEKGAIYRFTQGNTTAQAQITALRANDSTAVVISSDPGYVISVGDVGDFRGVGQAPATLPAPSGPLNPGQPMSTAPAPPQQAVVTGAMGKHVTLGIGMTDGARVGAVYTLPLGGPIKARIQIVQVHAADSSALIIGVDPDFTISVGDTAQFLDVEPVVAAPGAPAAPPKPTRIGMTGPAMPAAVAAASVLSPMAVPVSVQVEGSTATIASVDGTNVQIAAGSIAGVQPGANLPILRAGTVIGLLRTEAVSPNTTTAIVLWKDDSVNGILAGDAVEILGANPNAGSPLIAVSEPEVPAAKVPFETGASDFTVPKADKSYELLTYLATEGYVTSVSASVFRDEGARRQDNDTTITFSAAQLAGFVKEALENTSTRPPGERTKAALSQLVNEYKSDLIALGVSESELSPFVAHGFTFGYSEQASLSLDKTKDGSETFQAPNGTVAANGNANTSPTGNSIFRAPFEDRFGALRDRSGFDSRTDIFGQVTKNLEYYAKIDAGSDAETAGPNITRTTSTGTPAAVSGTNTAAFDGENPGTFTVRDLYASLKVQGSAHGLTINVGRQEYWWGVGHFGTTLLSDAAGGLDSVSSDFKRGATDTQGLYADLGRGGTGIRASLYGQNTTYHFGNSSKIGLSTVTIAPGDQVDPVLTAGAFLPIVSLYEVDKLDPSAKNRNDQTTIMGYAETGVAHGMSTYGEILLKDLAITNNDNIENRDGGLIGAHLFTPRDPSALGAYFEYYHVSSFTYLGHTAINPFDAGQSFLGGAPLGYGITPFYTGSSSAYPFEGGADSLQASAYYKATRKLRLSAGAQFADINSEDQQTGAESGVGFMRQRVYQVGASYDLARNLILSGRLMHIATDQPYFVYGSPSPTESQDLVSVQITRAF